MKKPLTAGCSDAGPRRAPWKFFVAWLVGCGVACAASAQAEPPAGATPPVAVVGTAYLKTRHTWRISGKNVGVARVAFDLQVDLCNGMRRPKGLPDVRPPDASLALLDVTTQEKYFDSDKALTLIVGHGLVLYDLQRYLEQSAASPGTAAPPDCSLVRVVEGKNGTLWRDGVRYRLLFKEGKAIGTHARSVTAQRTLLPKADWDRLPTQRFVGQTCREVPSPAAASPLLTGGKSCIWDVFPYVGYLNWPFALSGEMGVGGPGTLVESFEPIEAWSGRAIDASTFAMPAGMKVIDH